ncbi:hypothetical protein [Nonomuraea sp. SYSU D8015]|uniref:hypothetical protein n=1 Tax=Nonomuraea sp. SYSU D8015 TaxID=2593644 RepID=UPI0016607CBF|nr:hypothetical protein [Nonomuraea sp. SYSU D8015]
MTGLALRRGLVLRWGLVLRRIAERKNDIVYWGEAHSPSRMLTMAAPDTLVEGVRAFFRIVR